MQFLEDMNLFEKKKKKERAGSTIIDWPSTAKGKEGAEKGRRHRGHLTPTELGKKRKIVVVTPNCQVSCNRTV